MTLRTRLDRLERREGGGGWPCPGCGWSGLTLILHEYLDVAGRVVRVEDCNGNPLPGFPDIPSCDLCKGTIRFLVFRCPVGAATTAHCARGRRTADWSERIQ